jgi:hypothetical protein
MSLGLEMGEISDGVSLATLGGELLALWSDEVGDACGDEPGKVSLLCGFAAVSTAALPASASSEACQ